MRGVARHLAVLDCESTLKLGRIGATEMTPILRTRRVAFQYPQNRPGLEPTSLAVEPGGFLLVTGASGSGKSTLARCLVGLIPHLYRGHLSGKVWLDGLNTAEWPLWQLSERGGLVFQNPAGQMLAPTVEDEILFGLENLGLQRDEMASRLESSLERFQLGSFRARRPQTLSGGEQQKLALAAIMARQPPVLVLDEPLSMLDSTAAIDLVNYLEELAQEGTTIVICEHRAGYLDHIPGLQRLDLPGRSVSQQAAVGLPLPRAAPFRMRVSDLRVELGGRRVLDHISFEASGGEVVAIVGRNGTGKTTLLRALAGLQSFGGRIEIDGGRPDLGMVFQNPDLQLFNATVRDEVLFGLADPDWSLYRTVMQTMNLKQYEETPPLLLSEGEKKRLALATVLMHGPQHGVLLDEPSLGQDTGHKEKLMAVARALAGSGRLVLLTTHDLPLAAAADRILLLTSTGIVADGPPRDLMAHPGAWQRIGLTVPSWIMAPDQRIEAI
jgi:energy-coupling factor transporter ATP-binding protein EcfA2